MRLPSRCVGNAPQPAGVLLGEQRDDLGIDLGAAEVDDVEPELLGEHVGEDALAEETELDEDVAEPLARRGLLRQRVAELVLGDEAAADQQLAERAADSGAATISSSSASSDASASARARLRRDRFRWRAPRPARGRSTTGVG